MPRKPKADSDTVHKDARPGRNGYDPADVQRRFEAAEVELNAIAELKRQMKRDCQPHVDELKAITKAAAEDGDMPKKVFAAKLAERQDKRRSESRRAGLNESQQETFDQVSVALGDLAELPLGAAVLDKHEGAPAH